jgi:hypothetical protein
MILKSGVADTTFQLDADLYPAANQTDANLQLTGQQILQGSIVSLRGSNMSLRGSIVSLSGSTVSLSGSIVRPQGSVVSLHRLHYRSQLFTLTRIRIRLPKMTRINADPEHY